MGGREEEGRVRIGGGGVFTGISYVSEDALLFNAVACQGEKAREGRGRVGYRPPDT